MSVQARPFDVITVTLNPAIDRTLTIPGFAVGKVNRVEQTRDMAGGKGVNVASALADFGFRVAVTGFLGRDNAAHFETLFERKGIADHFVRINGSTRIGLKIVDPAQQETTDINFPGLNASAKDFDSVMDRIAELASGKPGWVVISGSLPPGMPVETYGKLVASVKAMGWNAVVDTSGEPLGHAVAAGPSVVKPNIHELEELAGHPLSSLPEILEAARQMLAQGVTLVAVSMGEKGALFVTKDELLTAKPPLVEVSGTVGAGDAMVAGIVASHLRGHSLPACARLATAFSLALLTRGQNDAILREEAINPWLDRVTIH